MSSTANQQKDLNENLDKLTLCTSVSLPVKWKQLWGPFPGFQTFLFWVSKHCLCIITLQVMKLNPKILSDLSEIMWLELKFFVLTSLNNHEKEIEKEQGRWGYEII